jgi:tyrosyl-tRNA synthetase
LFEVIMSTFPSVEEQLAIIARGTAQIETRDELKKKLERSLATGQPLRVKLGIDPTGFEVHLGHTVVLRKLRQFQELGHQVVLIIGTATAAVGDPSGRDESRKSLSPEKIEGNAETYLTQIAKVIDVSKAEIRRNGEWFSRFGFDEMLRLLGHTTVQRMIERDDFAKRIKEAKPIYLHECLYPLMQGWDSVEIRADVELGGTEQLYNLMVGRDLQRAASQEPQICLTMPILRSWTQDAEGNYQKMGKSLNNYIAVGESAKEQFGKTMRIPDALMKEWFALLTHRPDSEIDTIVAGHPNEAKKLLAGDIVTSYHGTDTAAATLADWNKQFGGGKQDPDSIDEVTISTSKLKDGAMLAVDLIAESKLAGSKGEARRKIEEGAFNYGPDRTKPIDVKATVAVVDGLVIRLGRKILRVRLA